MNMDMVRPWKDPWGLFPRSAALGSLGRPDIWGILTISVGRWTHVEILTQVSA